MKMQEIFGMPQQYKDAAIEFSWCDGLQRIGSGGIFM